MENIMRQFYCLALAGSLLLGGTSAFAQQGGGGPNMAAFQKFRDQHKSTFQLQTMLNRGLMEIERSPATKLKPDQAKKIQALIAPLRKQPKMTQAQAKTTIAKFQKILTAPQLAAVNRAVER